MWSSLTCGGLGIIGFARKAAICSVMARVVVAGVAPYAIRDVLPAPATVPPVPLPDAPEGPPRAASSSVTGLPLLRLLADERGVSGAIYGMHGRVIDIGSSARSAKRVS